MLQRMDATSQGRAATRRLSLRAALGVVMLGVVLFAPARFLFLSEAPSPSAAEPADEVAALEAAAQRRPGDVAALQSLAAAYVRRGAATADPAMYALAAATLDRAEQAGSEHPETLVVRGELALSLHDFAAAERIGERLRTLLPFSAEALGVLVDAQVELGRYDEAAGTLQTMLDLDPGLAALARASYLRELHGDLRGALQAMQQAETAGAASPALGASTAVLTGDLHLKRGELDLAAGAYRRADASVPGLPGARLGLARVAAAQGDAPLAIGILETLTERVPDPSAVVLLGELYDWQSRRRDAAETYELARALSRLQADSGQVLDLELALFEADHGDPQAAVAFAQRAHDARPGNVFASDALAWALLRAGRPEAAVAHARDALRLGTADGLLQLRAAIVLEAAGAREEARTALLRTTELRWAAPHYDQQAVALARALDVPVPQWWKDTP